MLKKINNNKGITSFIAIIIVMLLLAVFSFGFDLVNVVRKRHAFNRHINYVARVVARQGGVRPTKPDWIDRLDYETSGDLYNLTADVLEQGHIKDGDWELYIGPYKSMDKNKKLSSNIKTTFDFGDDIYIHGILRYSWPLTGAIMETFNGEAFEYHYVRKVASEAWDRQIDNNDWLDNTVNMNMD